MYYDLSCKDIQTLIRLVSDEKKRYFLSIRRSRRPDTIECLTVSFNELSHIENSLRQMFSDELTALDNELLF